MTQTQTLADRVTLTPDSVINPDAAERFGGISSASCVLVLLAAGKGVDETNVPQFVTQN